MIRQCIHGQPGFPSGFLETVAMLVIGTEAISESWIEMANLIESLAADQRGSKTAPRTNRYVILSISDA